MSNRELRDWLIENNVGKYSHAAIGRYKNKISDTSDTSKTIQNLNDPEKIVVKKQKLDPIEYPKINPGIPTFSQFMNKMEKSDSWGAKLLKEKLNVEGKYKKINQDRIIRIIQYTLDILQE